MPQLVNAQTNQVEDIGHDQAAQALQSGQYNLIKGQSTDVVDSSGKLVSLPNEQIPDALSSQEFRLPTSGDITEYQNEQKYGEGIVPTAEAAGAGLLRGATFNASDVALVKSGLTTPEALKQLAQRHEVVTPISEIAGAGAALALAPEAEGLQVASKALAAARETGDALKIAQAMKAVDAAKTAAQTTFTAADAYNPVSAVSKIGANITKAVTPEILTVPENNAIVGKILSTITPIAAKTLGSAAEGAIWGLGQNVSEDILGNADLNAENLMHSIGYGALIGGTFGSILGAGEAGFRGVKGVSKASIEDAALKHSVIEDAAKVSETGPTSMEQMQAQNQMGIEAGLEQDRPNLTRAKEINDVLAEDSKFPLNKLQMQSLTDPAAELEYKVRRDADSEIGKIARDQEMLQKQEVVQELIPKFIQRIAPDADVTSDAVEGGQKVVDSIKRIQKEQGDASKPFFDMLDKLGVKEIENPDEMLPIITKSIPGAEKLIAIKPEGTPGAGQYFMKKWTSRSGVSEGAYKHLKQVVDAMNEEHLSITEVRNMRNLMKNDISWTKPTDATQLTELRKNLMDYIQGEVDKQVPNVAVRDEMKKYALKAENQRIMEKILGGSFTNPQFGKGIETEKVLNNIFRSRENIVAARDIMGNDFNTALADYMSNKIAAATDPIKGLSSAQAGNLFKKQSLVNMQEAFAQHPEILAKLRASIDKAKLTADAKPGNPSMTAPYSEMIKKMKGVGDLLLHPTQIPGKVVNYAAGLLDERSQRAYMDKILAGQAEEDLAKKQRLYTVFSKIERIKNKFANSVDKSADAIFSASKALPGPAAAALTPDKFDAESKKLTDLATNPQAFLDKLDASTKDFHDIAPTITGSLHTASVRATEFLQSKLPNQEPPTPFSTPRKPSSSEIARFNRYYQVVQNPMVVMDQIKKGTLTSESVETIKTVYPQIYNQMTTALMNKITPETLAKMPYSTKLTLSMFMNTDLTHSLKAENIMSAQVSTQMQKMGQPTAPPKQARSLSKIDMSNQLLTPIQRTARRGQ